MAPRPPTLTAKALQALLVRIGSASSGNKGSLFDRFKQDLACASSLRRLVQVEGNRKTVHNQRDLRIMSIDMGIKNLAYCVADLRCSSSLLNTYNQPNAAVNISAWKKIDIIKRTHEYHTGSSNLGNVEETDADEDLDPYSLAVLSRTAHRLVTQEVLGYEPDIILIEKQRWRSGGGSAIQQWTIRVNTLEAMLWAILETQKGSAQIDARGKSASTKRDYEVFGIDPKRVGHYWLEQHARAVAEKTRSEAPTLPMSPSDEESAQGKKLSRSKAEKKAKISLLRSWLALNPASNALSTPLSYPEITFTFDPDTEPIRQAIYAPQKSAGRNKAAKRLATKEPQDAASELAVGTIADAELNKLDDVTDCFLQAAAWVAWELNKLQLLNARKSEGEEGEESALLDEAAVLRMIQHTQWTKEELAQNRTSGS
jgi:cruciform cutting endonuclease 1